MQSSHLFASSAIVAAAGAGLRKQWRPSISVQAFASRGGLPQFHVPDAKRLWSPSVGFRRRTGISGFRCGTHTSTASASGVALTVQEKAASWESLSEKLGGEKFGPPERLAHVRNRVFAPDQQPNLVFYRDDSASCPYCERVWLQLEEKKIAYTVEKVIMQEKPAWYTQLVPSGLLPAVMVDRDLLSESSLDIMFSLEQKFPDNNPLLPKPDTPEFAAMDELHKLERELFEAWLTRLTQPWKDMGAFETSMDNVNSSLERFQGPYFLGTEFSLMDAVYAPFLERIAASMPYWTGTKIRGSDRWPTVSTWFDAMDSRPSYQAVKSDDFSITHNLERQIGPCISAETGASYRALIDGTDGSWDLPLKPEVTAWGSDDGTGKYGAKEEAAQFLIQNHDRLVEFVLRGVKDSEMHRASVDLGFRCVAQALVYGIEGVAIEKGLSEEVATAAAYLRDRVGVPSDLTYPAARQFRAHLNWLVEHSGTRQEEPLTEIQQPGFKLQESNGDVQLSGVSSWLYPSKDELPDEKEMTIFDHLEELRDRLLISAVGVGAAILGCFCFAKNLIIILEAPVYSQGVRFLQLSPGEYFFTTLKVSGYCGLLIGSPLILYEIIAFVIPGLTRSERRFLGPIVLGSSVLFYTGVGFSYAVLTPAALNFFVNYAEGVVESLWSIDQYFEFVLVLLFSTGLSFQVPVIQLLLGQSRLVTADQMLSVWRYVVVGAVVAAAVLTPSTDPFTQVLLAGPLIGLYMGGALLVKLLVPEPDPS